LKTGQLPISASAGAPSAASNQPGPSRQQLPHHALLEGAGLVAADARSRGNEDRLCPRIHSIQPQSCAWIKELQSGGYVFHLIYLWLSGADLAVQRVAERVRRGGHDVAESIVRRRYARSLGNFFNIYRPIADSWLMLDNSQIDAPKPIAWRNVGGPVQVVKAGPWDRLREQHEKDIFPKR
jgi:hypothetical protein